MLDKFAEELKEQREKSGLTVQQLATKTRIDVKFLEAIELGNFAFLPELYVKAFIKQYAKTVGIDEELTLKKYMDAKEGKSFQIDPSIVEEKIEQNETSDTEPIKSEIPTTEETKPAVQPPSPLKSYNDLPKQNSAEDESKINKQLMMFGLGGVGVIIIAAILYFLVFNRSNEIIVAETPIEEVIAQSNERYVEKDPVEQNLNDNTIVPASIDSLYLTFSAKEISWVFVVLDNNSVKEFTLSPNSKFTLVAAKEFKATIGNSGGISLQLNNKPIDFTGQSGSVRHFKLDRTGLVYLNAPPKLEKQ
jgi:cytoskeletal protein RodZ